MKTHRCTECGHVAVWTKQRLVDALHAHVAEHGRPPASSDWHKAAPGRPTHTTVYRMFGSWAAFLKAAGFRSNTKGWTRPEAIDALTRWVFLNGRQPTSHEWDSRHEDRPTRGQCKVLFGSWNAFIVAAGYEPVSKHRTVEGYIRQAARFA